MQLFTPPTTHRDLLRIIPKSDLKELSDVVFVNQVLQLMISEDPHGYTRTASSRNYSRCLRPEKKSRDQPSLAKLVKNHEATLKLLMGSLAARRDTELDGWGRFMDGRIRMPCPQTIGGRPWGGRFDRCWIPTWFLCYRCWSQYYCLVYPRRGSINSRPPLLW